MTHVQCYSDACEVSQCNMNIPSWMDVLYKGSVRGTALQAWMYIQVTRGSIYLLFGLGYFFFNLLAVALRLHFCMWAFSSCRKQGLLFVGAHRPSHCSGFSCCGARALGAWSSVVAPWGPSSSGSWA